MFVVKQFIVEVDASNYAVGGVLLQQRKDSKFHPVAYISTALQKSFSTEVLVLVVVTPICTLLLSYS